MVGNRKYKILGSQIGLGRDSVELDGPVLIFTPKEGPFLGATALTRTGTDYDISPEGVIVRRSLGNPVYPNTAGAMANAVVTLDGDALSLDDRPVDVAGPFCQILFLNDLLVVVGRPKSADDLNKVFAVDPTGKVIWRIQTNTISATQGSAPYVGVCITGGNLCVIDSWGRMFVVDPKTGQIIGQAGWTK